jgi:ABC-type spermidine/putrescine transport system permease subunit II
LLASFRVLIPLSATGSSGMVWITTIYLAYLFAPMLLLLIGSFGSIWFGTLIPGGFTLTGTSTSSTIRVSGAHSG